MRQLKKELWPYSVMVNTTNDQIYDIEMWLGEQLGSFKDQWNAVHRTNSSKFYFRQGADAMIFKLKWY